MHATPTSARIALLLVLTTLVACGSDNDKGDQSLIIADRPAIPADQTPTGPVSNPLPTPPPAPMPAPIAPPVSDPVPPAPPAPVPASVPPSGFATWLELDSVNPETKSVTIFRGSDPALALLGLDADCSLYYLGEGTDEQGRTVLVFRTSYNHNGDTHPYLTLPKDSLKAPGVVLKRSDGLAEMYLKLRSTGDLSSVYAFNLKWFHINHYDTGTCDTLQRAQS